MAVIDQENYLVRCNKTLKTIAITGLCNICNNLTKCLKEVKI